MPAPAASPPEQTTSPDAGTGLFAHTPPSPQALRWLLHAAAALTAQPGAIALLSCPRKDARMLILARSANGALDMAQLLRESGARGGGKPDMAQGSAPDGAALESAKRILFNK